MPSANNVFSSFLTKKGPTVKAMQEILQRIGEATTGTKDVVQKRLLTRVWQNKVPSSTKEKASGDARILSIDMGIRNLAYCVADVETPSSILGTTKMNILAWRRMDLNDAFEGRSASEFQKTLADEAALDGREPQDPYTPESLSRMAFWFLNKTLLDWKPDIILIERQRWRSANSPTIQQWTLRVNTLEAIMWATLTTLKSERKQIFDGVTYAVDPKRVGHFWLDGLIAAPASVPVSVPTRGKGASKTVIEPEPTEEELGELEDDETHNTKKLSRGKAEKKAKIQLLRTWLNSDTPSTALTSKSKDSPASSEYPNISFSFSSSETSAAHSADATREAFIYKTNPPSERSKRTQYNLACGGKVDDITDCFLQAAAWVAWAENLRALRPQVEELQAQTEERLESKLIHPSSSLAVSVGELQEIWKHEAVIEKTQSKKAKKTSKKQGIEQSKGGEKEIEGKETRQSVKDEKSTTAKDGAEKITRNRSKPIIKKLTT